MLCDELKDYDYDPDFPFQSRGRFYDADEVESAIAELKAKLEEEREFGLNRAKSADHEIGKMCVEIKELKDKLRHYPMMVALLENDKKEIEERNAIHQKSLARLHELARKTYPDQEEDHIEADGILCNMLDALGYKDLTDAWDKIGKWYS